MNETGTHAVLHGRQVFPGLTVGTSRRRLIGGGIFTVLMLALVLWHTDEFLDRGLTYGTLLYGLTLAACVILGALTVWRWSAPGRFGTAVSLVTVFLLPIVAMTMVECLNGVFTWDWSPQVLILNYILYFLFYGLVYVCSGSIRLPMLIVNPLFFALALTNHYVCAFRGTPFIPMDFLAAGTAANVAATYDFSFDYQIVIAIVLLAFLEIAAYKLRTPAFGLIGKVATRTFFATLILCIVGLYFFTDQYAEAGLHPDFWNQSRGYRNSGVVLNFCLNTKYMYVTKPADYDPDEIASIVEDGLDDEPTPAAQTPNIICIMNESLADLEVLGDIHTNTDCLPFLHSLTENTVKGNLYVPVLGSGTSNTEFEFLTGVPTAFFPAGSNAYMLYVKHPLRSIVSTLSGQGYTTPLAFHPYYSSGWNRTKVYDYLGFSSFISIGSLIKHDILVQYQNSGFRADVLEQLVEEAYPGTGMLLRRYVSDSYNYRKVIEMYEDRDPEEPFFLFNVTMQNHGGYTEVSDNFDTSVYVVNSKGEHAAKQNADGELVAAYPRADQYFSLMQYSDDAFRELIEYFEQQEEPTVICMFGDHQPNIETSYIRDVMGVPSLYTLSTEDNQKRYVTPFVIWANYDIEEKTVERLSANYLSSYLMQVAGVEMPAYNRYLLKLSETLPVINTVGYIDADGNCYDHGQSSGYSPLIRDYEKVAYNLMFDDDHRADALFSLN